MIHKNTL